MCLGPRLPSGDRALVAVADNGGIGGPNRIVCFTIGAPAGGAAMPTLALAALALGGLVLAGLLAGRFSSP
jgi:hypothetical protein